MSNSIHFYSTSQYACTAAPYVLVRSLTQSDLKTNELFSRYTENALKCQSTSFFLFTISNQNYYNLCYSITVVAFTALGIALNTAVVMWAPQCLLTTLTLSGFIYYKFIPLFTITLKERIFDSIHNKSTVTFIFKKETELNSLTKADLEHKLQSLGVSSDHYYNELHQTPFLKNHPDREFISRAILINLLARYEYLQENNKHSMVSLKKWETELDEARKKLKEDEENGMKLPPEERLTLEETAEKLFAMIYELYEFDLPSERQNSLLSNSIKAAYLLHLMKNPLNTSSYESSGKVLPKQFFERVALGNTPSSQSFFLTKDNRYIPRDFFVKNLQNISDIEKHIFQ